MAMMNDLSSQRSGKFGPGFMNNSHLMNPYGMRSQAPRQSPYIPKHLNTQHPETNMNALASGLGGMNLQQSHYGATAHTNGQMHQASGDYSNMSLSHAQPYYGQQQPVYYGNSVYAASTSSHGGVPLSPSTYTNAYMQQNNYNGYGQQVHDHSPLTTHGWSSRVTSGEVPSLMTPRRDSISSTENDLPGTPYTSFGMLPGGVNVDRSPSVVYASSQTPSPSGLNPMYAMQAVAKVQPPTPISPKILSLLQQDPSVPPAIPAPSSPPKPLDRSLENKLGETNVYIRGLLPETTDEMLQQWGSRFGDIQSSKSIIDSKTNLCKGYGFIKYHNYEDAEDCIRGFHHLGYEVSFARESFYSKLKKFADEKNTNLYISNIPRNMNEAELSASFAPYQVISSKILRDAQGHGRGVGFARFDSRDTCEQVICAYNNTPIYKNGEEFSIQIRYADTQEQKMLKQQTAAGRQFRAAEYEFGVAQARGTQMFAGRLEGLTAQEQEAASEFESFMSNNSSESYRGFPTRNQGFANRNNNLLPPATQGQYPRSIANTFASRCAQQGVTLPSIVKVEHDGSTSQILEASPTSPATIQGDGASSASNAASDHEQASQ